MIKIFILLLALISILQDLLIRHRLKKAFPERPWIHRIYLASFLLLDTLIVIALTCYRMAPDATSPRYVWRNSSVGESTWFIPMVSGVQIPFPLLNEEQV